MMDGMEGRRVWCVGVGLQIIPLPNSPIILSSSLLSSLPITFSPIPPPLPNTRSPVVRILLVTKKSGNRERCRKLSL